MAKQIFVNLPVRDLRKATAFYAALGAVKNPQFSDDTASCMVVSESIFVMLLTHDKWAFFTKKPIVDARHQSEVIVRRTAPPARRPRTDGQQTDPGQAHRGREGREIETAVPPAERRHAAARRGHASPSTLFAANHADATARLSRRARRARPWPCSIRCPRRKTNCRSSRRDKGEDRGRPPSLGKPTRFPGPQKLS